MPQTTREAPKISKGKEQPRKLQRDDSVKRGKISMIQGSSEGDKGRGTFSLLPSQPGPQPLAGCCGRGIGGSVQASQG